MWDLDALNLLGEEVDRLETSGAGSDDPTPVPDQDLF